MRLLALVAFIVVVSVVADGAVQDVVVFVVVVDS